MSRLLGRLGEAAAAHPWRTICAWLIVLVAFTVSSSAFGGTPHDDYNVPGTESQAGTEFLRARLPQLSGADARVVVHGKGPVDPATLEGLRGRLAAMPGAGDVSPPRMSADGDTALVAVRYTIPVTDFRGTEGMDALRGAAEPLVREGLQVEFGGQVAENISAPSGTAEAVGIVVALLILVLALGSVVAAGLPLIVAIAGLGVATAVIALLEKVTDISGTAPTIATMVGLGVGIDYALLLVARHVEGLRAGLTPREAAAAANATAGSSVIVAGLTVLVSLFGLKLSTLPVYSSFGYATFAAVGAVMVASVTLVPALCGLAGRRVLPRKARRAAAGTTTGAAPAAGAEGAPAGWTARWATVVGRRPVVAALGSLLVLAALSAPVLGMRTWPQDAGSQPTSNTTRLAYDLTSTEFGPGANGPLVIAVDTAKVPDVDGLVAALRAQPGVALVAPAARTADAAVIIVEPATGPQDERTTALLDHLRADVLPDGALVTGLVAVFADISDRLADRLWVVVAFVVALSLLLLTVLFRAPVVAVKAAVMNLLSVAAAYGVMTAVFQTDAGARAVGLPHAVPVSSWVPILLFTVLFGLSMDYEVFLLSRVREDWLATGDAQGSVVRGLSATGRVISGAAAIMVAVFVGFALDPDVTVKMTGVGMAAAVLIDATLVRLVLVPATMSLLGRANWWLPGWLDRLLPHVKVEAEPERKLEPVG
ncbi:MMPL family transporter [Dactylosporangium aurantiacum]|uniref:MMPL family transporter n=1 Tax=Dactylosporangium aurantiacum TaxID=35754 RepID=A0A9Q9MII7_9ACTN|nr:MMPL family transporter [Dactylosporangium aurantiacum]MDG6108081.1 MMPL family transporter [Dactylosporangium aurantiacum]UWZ53711.1 MMPL family transporter [Dactylosporangium aurantiacum]